MVPNRAKHQAFEIRNSTRFVWQKLRAPGVHYSWKDLQATKSEGRSLTLVKLSFSINEVVFRSISSFSEVQFSVVCENRLGLRSSRLQIFFKLDFLKIFTNFTGKHFCFYRCFPVKFERFLEHPFSQNTSRGCLPFSAWKYWS